jgi:8-amino-3,8-dideoxy-alpha-D-manno-octulosonate transaminase
VDGCFGVVLQVLHIEVLDMLQQKLAIDGGPRARSRPDVEKVMRIGALQIADAERLAVDQVLRQQILYRYHGRSVAEFESRFADWLGAKSPACLAVNSGSSALLLTFAALELGPGDEVLLPTIGFISAATAIMAVGGTPRFVPVDRSLGMDPAMAAASVTTHTRALLAVHPYGSACNLSELQRVTDQFGGSLIEDAAQACGAEYRGRRVGTFGLASCFSFQHFKVLTTGEGGMIVTSNSGLLDQVSFIHDAAAMWTMPERASRVDTVRLPPLNLRMSELEGALGLSQLARCDGILGRSRAIKRVFRARIEANPAITLRPHADIAGDSGTSLIFFVKDPATASWVASALQSEGVGAATLRGEPGTNRHWVMDWLPILRKAGYQEVMNVPPMADSFRLEDGVILPIDVRYSQEDIDETLLALDKVMDGL